MICVRRREWNGGRLNDEYVVRMDLKNPYRGRAFVGLKECWI